MLTGLASGMVLDPLAAMTLAVGEAALLGGVESAPMDVPNAQVYSPATDPLAPLPPRPAFEIAGDSRESSSPAESTPIFAAGAATTDLSDLPLVDPARFTVPVLGAEGEVAKSSPGQLSDFPSAAPVGPAPIIDDASFGKALDVTANNGSAQLPGNSIAPQTEPNSGVPQVTSPVTSPAVLGTGPVLPQVAQDAPDRATVRTADGRATVALDAHGHNLEAVVNTKAPSPSAGGPALPLGLFGFNVKDVTPGGIATVDLRFPAGRSFNGYYKQDPTGALTRFDWDGTTGAVFHGRTVTLYLQDGGRGDLDGLANGVIVDPGGPGVTQDDSYTVLHDQELVVDAADGMLANDTDPENDPLQVVSVSDPAHGTLTFQVPTSVADGSFRYLPDPQYVGTDSFTYTISDGTSESDPATVAITVTNEDPVGDSDSFTGTSEDIAITGNVQDNDFDADADPTRSLVATTTSHGDLNLGDDGSFIYTPDVNYFGSDSFTYTLTDGLATTGPITVDLTVPAGGPFDLDGHDRATQTVWMPEPDEGQYGLGVSTSDSATIFARVYNVPPDMVIDRRRINFNPSVLSVNGVTSPGYIELSPSGGNEVLTVTALVEGYGSSGINYEIFGHFNTGGPFHEAFATLCSMPVVEEKAELKQLEFTSDHNVIRNNTRIDITSGDRYSDVEFVRATKYNAPMTQTMSYNTQPSKMKVKVTVDWAGIPANTPVKLVGTSTETALQFESDLRSTGDLAGEGVVEITATNDVGKKIRTISGTIAWKMIVNPGPNQKELSMGTSGSHKIYVLFGTPKKQDKKPFQATDIRMDRTVAVASKALENAQAAVPPGTTTLTWQRIAYHVAQLQKFNGEEPRVEAPLDDKQITNGWTVYKTWSYTPPGSDCISGATFAWLVVVASGMPGESSADAFAPKSATEPAKAVSYDPTDPARHRDPGTGKQDLGMVDRTVPNGVYNAFEAALIYKPDAGASTFYFPIGFDARFTNKDDVISVMKQAVWVRGGTNTVVEGILPVYTRAADAVID